MRIISGEFRGKILRAPKGLPVRPTTDYAKTGLFNILNNRIDYESTKVLDMFAGIGSISFEFLSRGCSQITSVEMHKKSTFFMRKIADELDANDMDIITMDCFRYLDVCNSKFDLIFADPPYDHPKTDQLLSLIIEKGLLNSEGIFILEHSTRKKLPVDSLFSETRKYGEVAFSFYTSDVNNE